MYRKAVIRDQKINERTTGRKITIADLGRRAISGPHRLLHQQQVYHGTDQQT